MCSSAGRGPVPTVVWPSRGYGSPTRTIAGASPSTSQSAAERPYGGLTESRPTKRYTSTRCRAFRPTPAALLDRRRRIADMPSSAKSGFQYPRSTPRPLASCSDSHPSMGRPPTSRSRGIGAPQSEPAKLLEGPGAWDTGLLPDDARLRGPDGSGVAPGPTRTVPSSATVCRKSQSWTDLAPSSITGWVRSSSPVKDKALSCGLSRS